jgi:hypothetical protein
MGCLTITFEEVTCEIEVTAEEFEITVQCVPTEDGIFDDTFDDTFE